ncbi:hypothetical protein Pla108_42180 [Botrimarina colliarenosi]|uniref:Uncharacterized protein n=1 Tax=Botrimarina colliarenosi TaxID=2528001 RepID=A0A5C5ZVL2_9BACT|nr:hypothetical protein Pla108_42180 [Botrimarina colliarenosi]
MRRTMMPRQYIVELENPFGDSLESLIESFLAACYVPQLADSNA